LIDLFVVEGGTEMLLKAGAANVTLEVLQKTPDNVCMYHSIT